VCQPRRCRGVARSARTGGRPSSRRSTGLVAQCQRSRPELLVPHELCSSRSPKPSNNVGPWPATTGCTTIVAIVWRSRRPSFDRPLHRFVLLGATRCRRMACRAMWSATGQRERVVPGGASHDACCRCCRRGSTDSTRLLRQRPRRARGRRPTTRCRALGRG
jgi:hypothetical protein